MSNLLQKMSMFAARLKDHALWKYNFINFLNVKNVNKRNELWVLKMQTVQQDFDLHAFKFSNSQLNYGTNFLSTVRHQGVCMT